MMRVVLATELNALSIPLGADGEKMSVVSDLTMWRGSEEPDDETRDRFAGKALPMWVPN